MFNKQLFQTKNNVINTPQYFVRDCMEYGLLYLGVKLILFVVFTFKPPHVIFVIRAFHSVFKMQAASGSRKFETKKCTFKSPL